MTLEEIERDAWQTASAFPFIVSIQTILRTPGTLTMRFVITNRSFVQLYTNPAKSLVSYTLIVAGNRLYGRDSEGGHWHRHPFEAPETHDHTDEGQKSVTFAEFLEEVEAGLRRLEIL